MMRRRRVLLPVLLLVATIVGATSAVDTACNLSCDDATPPAGCTVFAPSSATNPAQDLAVSECFIFQSGSYVFHHVNVLAGGIVWFEDDGNVIDFRVNAMLVEQGGRVVGGRWCKPFGCNGGNLQIGLWGTDPTNQGTNLGVTGIRCQTAGGCYPAERVSNKQCCNVSSSVSDPCNSAGSCALENQNALFEAYSDNMYDGPGNSFGHKVLAVSYGGSVELFGRNGVAPSDFVNPALARPTECETPADPFSSDAWAQLTGQSWVRLGVTAAAGQSTITLDRPVRWRQGDKIILTTTDWYPSHTETAELAADVVDSATVTLVAPLAYNHFGSLIPMDEQLSENSNNPNKDADVRAAVGLLSRSIKVYSLGATSTDNFPASSACTVATNNPACYFGGHTVVRQGFGRYQIQGVEFHQLGQGGRMGHYPVHIHLAKQVYYTNVFVKDSSSWDSMTRFFTVHASSGVTLARNVGYLSVGHGYYFEDGSEINNLVCHNLAATIRVPLKDYLATQQPTSPTARAVPGIVPSVQGLSGILGGDEYMPVGFWFMNMWNDVVGNMVSGVLGWGSCFWLLGSSLSGPSRQMKWTFKTGTDEDYANWLSSVPRIAPIKRFRGCSCSTAPLALQTAIDIYPSKVGLTGFGGPGPYGKNVVINPYTITVDMLPIVTQNFVPTKINSDFAYYQTNDAVVCSRGIQLNTYPPTAATDNYKLNAGLCSTAVIDRFRTSYNWPEVNFGSIWLRGYWFLFSNSLVTDQVFGGLGFVTGGSWLDAVPGLWMLAYNNIFIGATQPESATAGRAGPSFPESDCLLNTKLCPFKAEGVAYALAGFQPSRLITIYDGPFFADGNIFMAAKNFTCDPSEKSSSCGIYRMTTQPVAATGNKQMNVINAGIGWKQPNGFYYPPAFAFRRSAFDEESMRHNVLDITAEYITASPQQPPTISAGLGVTPIDASTILVDVDGSLTGVTSSITGRSSSVSENTFYLAPTTIAECKSFGVNTVPNDMLTSVITMAARSTMHPAWFKVVSDWSIVNGTASTNYTQVPLYRQFLLPTDRPCSGDLCESVDSTNNMFSCTNGMMMAGSLVWSAPALTMSDMTYFIDTHRQSLTGPNCKDFNFIRGKDMFVPSDSYVLYQLYPQRTSKVTYQIYVGTSFNLATDGHFARIYPTYNIDGNSRAQPIIPVALPGVPTLENGVLTVTLDNAWIADDFDIEVNEDYVRCLPRDVCDWDSANSTCKVADSVTDPQLRDTYETVCRYWATRASGNSAETGDGLVDCPAGGCLAYVFTLPSDFVSRPYAEVGAPLARPFACTAEFAAFNASLVLADIPGNTCQATASNLCRTPKPPRLGGVLLPNPDACSLNETVYTCDCTHAASDVVHLSTFSGSGCTTLSISGCRIRSSKNALSTLALEELTIQESLWLSGPAEPSDLGLGASVVRLTYNGLEGITTLGAFGFHTLTNLEELSLNALYDLESVDYNAFEGLTSLIYFEMMWNTNLERIPGKVFQPLQSTIESIDLQGCGLTRVPGLLFANLKKLEYIGLNHNQLTTLPVGLFHIPCGALLGEGVVISGNPFEGDVPGTYDTDEVIDLACDATCLRDCFDSASQCCDASCRTCSGSATYCTSCMSGEAPIDGACTTLAAPPAEDLALFSEGQLSHVHTASYFAGFADCWVQYKANSYAEGYRFDDQLCCRRLGRLDGLGNCNLGCDATPTTDFVIVAPVSSTDAGARCYGHCAYL
ncbi:hypothetical protein CAOG_08583 [Capsaspora owczarzaki ATCC 30864]|uniref:CEMIP beta-helix domain-containing protein n=1 Tax=Capsaspora owczarzaki (strain ATCC 30864) TaxID=595528 RepID=A0A0D2VLB8_CAPO3|nr:hypothetical protein CAOG_08583 [Capsaspora owczarzaki ATCC 30864]KJE90907.1 hypothetical protein CAOG_008583 [Capsaspora owczarzaki ATCC 30864]|eukprot:XP_011270183.1 hypothetical protein CAOG_08583 [Capsaspora owczarzaki ATCC 30864]